MQPVSPTEFFVSKQRVGRRSEQLIEISQIELNTNIQRIRLFL